METVGPDGQISRGAPPQPGLVMKGRSIDKLLRQVEAWHSELVVQQTENWIEWTPAESTVSSPSNRTTNRARLCIGALWNCATPAP